MVNLSSAEKNDLIEVYDVLIVKSGDFNFFKRVLKKFMGLFSEATKSFG